MSGEYEGKKFCGCCGEFKPVSEFGKSGDVGLDGLRSYCKICSSRGVALSKEQRRAANRRTVRNYSVIGSSAWKRHIATVRVHDAVRDGKLTRQPCEVCGAEPTEAHHDDYDKPLEVRWLCRKHHREYHKQLRLKK